MLKKILLAIAAIVVVLVGVVALQPSQFRIVRSAAVAAPPANVFAEVNDFRKWEAWSPWAKLDPAAKATFEGPASGRGAIFKWSGNDKIGEGRMTLTESRPNDLVRIDVAFVRPFEGTNVTEFTFRPDGDRTTVTWSMAGELNFIAKGVGLVMNMDKMLGGEMEQGLARMKTLVEAGARK